jgi:hypothetical protein
METDQTNCKIRVRQVESLEVLTPSIKPQSVYQISGEMLFWTGERGSKMASQTSL